MIFKKNTILFYACFLVTFIFIVVGCYSDVEKSGKNSALRLEPSEKNPRNSEGDFIQLNDGQILFVYSHFTGGAGDNAKAYLAGRYSSDGGKTWTDEDVMIVPNEGGMNVMSVSLLRLQNGNIAFFYARKNSTSDCRPLMRISTDEAKTWSEPKLCVDAVGYYVINNDRVIQLNNGRILLPLSLHKTPDTEVSGIGRILCYFSDDNGQTWSKSEHVSNKENIVLQEPGLVELKDGRLMLFCRTDTGVQYMSFSSDNGESWSPVQPGNITSPLSPASIERIPSTGDLLLLWNNNDKPGGKRTPFNLAISKDEGQSWEKMKNLEVDPYGWYCYTAIEFVGDFVLLGHCAGDVKTGVGLATTQITRLSLDWVYQDPVANPFIESDNNGTIILGCPTDGAEIRYTMDGSLPTLSSTTYKDAISVEKTIHLMFRAFKKGQVPSALIMETVGMDIFQESQNPDFLEKGLVCDYFEGDFHTVKDLTDRHSEKSSVLPQFSIQPRKKDIEFGFTYSGFIDVPRDGLYTFYVKSNDGSVMFLNGDRFIDNDGLHEPLELSNSTSLRVGKHRIAVHYFQSGGGKELQVSWKGPGIEKQEIPASVLFHAK